MRQKQRTGTNGIRISELHTPIIAPMLISGTTRASDDDFGRAVSRTSASGLTLTYNYNALDQPVSISYPPVGGNSAGTAITYAYDSANGQLLDSVTDRAGTALLFR